MVDEGHVGDSWGVEMHHHAAEEMHGQLRTKYWLSIDRQAVESLEQGFDLWNEWLQCAALKEEYHVQSHCRREEVYDTQILDKLLLKENTIIY